MAHVRVPRSINFGLILTGFHFRSAAGRFFTPSKLVSGKASASRRAESHGMSCSIRVVCLVKIDDRARERESKKMRERWVLSDGGCTEGKVWFFWTEPKSCVKMTRILSSSWHSIAHFVNCIALTVLFEIAGNSADEGCANFFYSTLHRGECLRQVNLVEFWEAILFFGRTVIPVLLSLFFCSGLESGGRLRQFEFQKLVCFLVDFLRLFCCLTARNQCCQTLARDHQSFTLNFEVGFK